jgi:predicted flap endonuclease-1-like 5' DNA nuclease
MTSLLIILILTKGVAILHISLLLLVSVVIGYVTAMFYYKSIYLKKSQVIESEKTDLKTEVKNLQNTVENTNQDLSDRDVQIGKLQLKVKALKALHAEAVHETDDMKIKNKQTENLLYLKNEDVLKLRQEMNLLDYNSFGTATEEEKDDLKMISGIGPFLEEMLNAIDIYTYRQVSQFSILDIDTIDVSILYFSGRIERDEWVKQAKELVKDEDERVAVLDRIKAKKDKIYFDRIGVANREEADDLTLICGIGGWINEKLNALDIYTFRQISNFDKEDIETVTDTIEYFPGRIERDDWISQAEELRKMKIGKQEFLKRIIANRNRIDWDRIGVANKYQANNFTLIKGINLWIEEKLNMLEIYTFNQLSNFTPASIKILAEIIGISASRIERNDWIGQALVLEKKRILQDLNI